MVVAVDERRNHRLPCEVDATRARRRLPLSLLADPRECLAFDEERRVLDRRATVADDQARTFEQRGSRVATLQSLESRPEHNESARQHASKQ